jgi:hypothetical protein
LYNEENPILVILPHVCHDQCDSTPRFFTFLLEPLVLFDRTILPHGWSWNIHPVRFYPTSGSVTIVASSPSSRDHQGIATDCRATMAVDTGLHPSSPHAATSAHRVSLVGHGCDTHGSVPRQVALVWPAERLARPSACDQVDGWRGCRH